MTVAVVVATYNRPAQLRRLLECLAAQTAKAEVIVVDDGSDVPLDELVRPFHCTLIRQANAGPASARNRGVAAAKSDFIAFTDDDCEPEPTWLENLLGRLQAHPACLAGGRTVNAAAGNAYAEASQMIVDMAYGFYRNTFFASNNMAMSRREYLECGGMDESFRVASEDRELCDRWRNRGGTFQFVEDAVVGHRNAQGFVGFLRTHFSYGRGAFRFHRARRRRGSAGLLPELWFVTEFRELYGKANAGGARLGHLQSAWLLALWQVANTAGALYELFWIVASRGKR
ncbi:MAG: glycosyltransferase [Acidobacteria bacterium]|nr:glycosyltransferase [Acidobacteriota bacterium]